MRWMLAVVTVVVQILLTGHVRAGDPEAIAVEALRCWNPPSGVMEAGPLSVSIALRLDASGQLQGMPRIVDDGASTVERAAGEAMLRAVRRCAPYKVSQAGDYRVQFGNPGDGKNDAAETCPNGSSSKILALGEWSASPGDYRGSNVRMELQDLSEKGMRMVKAIVRFTDPFGDSIADLQIDPDIRIEPRGTHIETGVYPVARLTRVHPDDVKTAVCVTGVVYADGTHQEF